MAVSLLDFMTSLGTRYTSGAAGAALRALVGTNGMFYRKAPSGATLPYVIYRVIPPGVVEGAMSGGEDDLFVVDFIVYCDEFDSSGNALLETQGLPIRDAIIDLYKDWMPVFSSGKVNCVYRDSVGVPQEDPDEGHFIPISFRYRMTA
jgi:hypothetical protein